MPDEVAAPETEAEIGAASFEVPRPRVGTAVMVAHVLGTGAVPADLEGAGFEVVVATDGETALAAVRAGRADIALVDGRFEGDGITFCEELWSENPGFPVLIIGPNDENLVTKALTSGADDYLALPLRPAELVARVRAVLRRAPHWAGEGRHPEPALHVGEVRLDPDSHEVTLRSARLHLPLREFELLRLLMENAGIVLPRATLLSRLWGPSAPLESTSLEVHIRRLRAKLEDDPAGPKRIVTVRGIGYRYQAER
ncbi:MAG TPA: response regulator transcription factor [Acidimicrobiales bacterium]|nr:response regulator transcription factor [Acidimicrobiales bacterium]